VSTPEIEMLGNWTVGRMLAFGGNMLSCFLDVKAVKNFDNCVSE